MSSKEHLLMLADKLAEFDGVTHWAISMRVLRKGDFFSRLMSGHTCRNATYRKVVAKFDGIWPADLDWPSDIPRPSRKPADGASELKAAS